MEKTSMPVQQLNKINDFLADIRDTFRKQSMPRVRVRVYKTNPWMRKYMTLLGIRDRLQNTRRTRATNRIRDYGTNQE